MATPLRDLYDELKRASTAEQHRTSEGLLAELERPGAAPSLAALFADSLAGNAAFDNVGQPFLNGASLKGRKPRGPDSARGQPDRPPARLESDRADETSGGE